MSQTPIMKPVSSHFSTAFAPPAELDRARVIMGSNFFGVEDAVKHFKLEPAPEHLAALEKIPFAESDLEERKESHLLVAALPLSILDLHGTFSRQQRQTGLILFHNQSWYRSGNDGRSPEPFAQEPGEPGWHLLRKTPVPNSVSKRWDEQIRMIEDQEDVPEARVLIYATIGHFLVTGDRLFQTEHARTSTIEHAGLRVGIGDFDTKGLFLAAYWDEARNPRVGVSTELKA